MLAGWNRPTFAKFSDKGKKKRIIKIPGLSCFFISPKREGLWKCRGAESNLLFRLHSPHGICHSILRPAPPPMASATFAPLAQRMMGTGGLMVIPISLRFGGTAAFLNFTLRLQGPVSKRDTSSVAVCFVSPTAALQHVPVASSRLQSNPLL